MALKNQVVTKEIILWKDFDVLKQIVVIKFSLTCISASAHWVPRCIQSIVERIKCWNEVSTAAAQRVRGSLNLLVRPHNPRPLSAATSSSVRCVSRDSQSVLCQSDHSSAPTRLSATKQQQQHISWLILIDSSSSRLVPGAAVCLADIYIWTRISEK